MQSVSIENVPSFVYHREVSQKVREIGELVVDVVFGGLFFVLVNADRFEIELIPENAGWLVDLGMHILKVANQEVSVQHPDLPHINKIIDLRFYEDAAGDGVDSRNVVILGDHMIDRSPCGTGTCAEVALRYARDQLRLGDKFVTESIIGTHFTGQVIAETQVGEGFPAVIPVVTGSAFITGHHQFVLNSDDPFPEGFLLSA